MAPAPVPAFKPAWCVENLPDGLDIKKSFYFFDRNRNNIHNKFFKLLEEKGGICIQVRWYDGYVPTFNDFFRLRDEDKDSVTLYADLPGVAKDGLDVHIDKDMLQIFGRRTARSTDDAAGANYTEMPARDYYRAFTIGEEVDREHISAHLTNGVLKVVLPKSERAKPKKIDIKCV